MWKLEGITLLNAGGLVPRTYTMSLLEGKIKNLTKNTLLGVNLDNFDLEEISSHDDLGKSPNGAQTPPGQVWKTGASNRRGYFTLKNLASGRYLTTSSSCPDKLMLRGIFYLYIAYKIKLRYVIWFDVA